MSHDATNWAIKQRGLKPTTKLVLWHLADRHNPDFGCFPRQDTLAADVEISRSTLNEHLALLEAKGLIRRVARIDPKTKRQTSTRYILGCEAEFALHAAEPCPEIGHGTSGGEAGANEEHPGEPCPVSGHGAVSGKPPEPCPENGESRVRIPDTNLVREPLREPVRRARAREAGVGENSDDDRPPENPSLGAAFVAGFTQPEFDRFWEIYPSRVEREEARRAFAEVLASGATSAETLVMAARRYAESPEVQRGFVMKPANWLSRGAYRDHAQSEPPAVDLDALARQWAGAVIAGRSYAGAAIRPNVARRMLDLQLVTAEQLRAVGVVF